MNYNILIPKILKNEVSKNPKGYFSRLRLTHKRILNWIINRTQNIKENATIGERVYWIINHLTDYPLCEECHKNIARFYNVIKGYGLFCSLQCAGKNEDKIKRSIQTSIDHFGKGNVRNRIKARQTCKRLYGEEYYMNTQEFKDDLKDFLNAHNVNNTFQIPEIIDKCIKSKRKKYGDHFEKITEKQIRTVHNFSKAKKQQIKEKRIQTCKDTYGVCFSSQAESVKEKVRNSNRKTYGVDYPMQSAEHRKNRLGRRYKYDERFFESQDELALYIWLNDYHIAFTYQPNDKFEYEFNGIKKYYFPDFKIGKKFFEIKGSHFFKEDGTMQNPWDHSQDGIYEAKHQCMLKNHVTIILTNSQFIKSIKTYIKVKYGNNYLKSFKIVNLK